MWKIFKMVRLSAKQWRGGNRAEAIHSTIVEGFQKVHGNNEQKGLYDDT